MERRQRVRRGARRDRGGARAIGHPLDRPVWSALTTRQSALAVGGAGALRFDPAMNVFGAAADLGDLDALIAMVPQGDELWVVESEAVALPEALVRHRRPVAQMVAEQPAPALGDFDFLELGDADAAEMRALAEMTKPGPFRERTHRMGRFIGVREGGRLIAMAGERMRPEGFTEVSGVCTHPDWRGRGLAGKLMRAVGARIAAEGDTPFLHVYPDNAGAIALYETLGYRRRGIVTLTVLAR